jgi:HEAT repeat protein
MQFLSKLFKKKPNTKKCVAQADIEQKPNIEKYMTEADIEGLIKAIDYPHDRKLVVSAVTALGQIGDATTATAPLLKVLMNNSDDERFCDSVYSSLLGFTTYSEIKLLRALRNLQSPIVHNRILAVRELSELGDVRAFQHLVAALKDSDREVRQRAAAALGKQGTQALDPLKVALKSDDCKIAHGAAEGLANLCIPQCVEPLINALSHNDWFVRCGVAEALGKLRDSRAVEPLVAAMGFEKPTEEVLRDAFKDHPSAAYGTSEAKLGAAFLYGNLALSGNQSAQKAAAKALGEIGDSRAVAPLIAALNSGENDLQVTAADALGNLADSRAVDSLIELLLKEGIKKELRIAVANALGQIGDVRAIAPLIDLYNDVSDLHRYDAGFVHGNWDIRNAIAEALGKMGMPSFEFLSTALREGKTFAAYGLVEIKDTRAIEALIAALNNMEVESDLYELVKALGRAGDPRAVDPLIEALENQKSLRVAEAAAKALGEMRAQRAVSPLIAMLNNSEQRDVKKSIINALGKIGDRQAIEPLISALKDEKLMYSAAEALVGIGSPSINSLITKLNDKDSYVRKLAAEALGQIGNAEAAEPLREMLRKHADPQLRWVVARALEKTRGMAGN